MEHRFFSRKRIILDINLFHGGQYLGCFGLRNIGLGGLFIETGPIDLSPNMAVEVGLPINDEEPETGSMKGLIVHRSDEGVGIMLTDHEPSDIRTIGRLMRNCTQLEATEEGAYAFTVEQVA